jgi:hypothetical protein
MFEIVIPYSIVVLFSIFSIIASEGRILVAQNVNSRKQASLSLVEATIMLAISVAAIYLGLNAILSLTTVAVTSLILLVLNYLIFWKYSKSE